MGRGGTKGIMSHESARYRAIKVCVSLDDNDKNHTRCDAGRLFSLLRHSRAFVTHARVYLIFIIICVLYIFIFCCEITKNSFQHITLQYSVHNFQCK